MTTVFICKGVLSAITSKHYLYFKKALIKVTSSRSIRMRSIHHKNWGGGCIGTNIHLWIISFRIRVYFRFHGAYITLHSSRFIPIKNSKMATTGHKLTLNSVGNMLQSLLQKTNLIENEYCKWMLDSPLQSLFFLFLSAF